MKYLIILITILPSSIFAQCNGSGQWPFNTLNAPNWSMDTTSISTIHAGEYSLVDDFKANETYIINSDSLHEDFITITTEVNNTVSGYQVVASGVPPLTVAIPGTGPYYVHLNLAVGCGSESLSRKVSYVCTTCPEAFNVGIGTEIPVSSAALDIQSSNQGLKIPSMPSSIRDEIGDPVDGLIIYNSQTKSLDFYNSLTTEWEALKNVWESSGFQAATLGNIELEGGGAFSNINFLNPTTNRGLSNNSFGFWHTVNGSSTVGLETSSNVAWEPFANNGASLGTSSFRWTEVWSTNGTIQTSDARLKKNVIPISDGLNKINALNPVSYNWKLGDDQNTHIGFLAQELELIIPEAIVHKLTSAEEIEAAGIAGREISLDTYGVKYAELIPVIVKAMQELHSKNEQLRIRIEELEKD